MIKEFFNRFILILLVMVIIIPIGLAIVIPVIIAVNTDNAWWITLYFITIPVGFALIPILSRVLDDLWYNQF